MLRDLSVILARPRFPENIGMVARAMANMGADELVLVDPERWAYADGYLQAGGECCRKAGEKRLVSCQVTLVATPKGCAPPQAAEQAENHVFRRGDLHTCYDIQV